MRECDILTGKLLEGVRREGLPNTLIVLRPADLWNLVADRFAIANLATGLAKNLVDSQVVGDLHLASNVSVCVGEMTTWAGPDKYDVVVLVDVQLLDIDRLEIPRVPGFDRADRILSADQVGIRVEVPEWLTVTPAKWKMDKPPVVPVPPRSVRIVNKLASVSEVAREQTLLPSSWQLVRKPGLHVPGGSHGDYEIPMPYCDGCSGALLFPLEFGSASVSDGDMAGLRTVKLRIVDVARQGEMVPVVYRNTLERMTTWLKMLLVPVTKAVTEGAPIQEFGHVPFDWVISELDRAFTGVGHAGAFPGNGLVQPEHFMTPNSAPWHASPVYYPSHDSKTDKWYWQETDRDYRLAQLPEHFLQYHPNRAITLETRTDGWIAGTGVYHSYFFDGDGTWSCFREVSNPRLEAREFFTGAIVPQLFEVSLWSRGILVASYRLDNHQAYQMLYKQFLAQKRGSK